MPNSFKRSVTDEATYSEPMPIALGTLPNGLDPFTDESLAGFVMRLAENHGYSRPMQLLAPLRLRLSTLQRSAHQGTAHPFMAEYLALSPDELRRLSSGQGPNCRVLGHELYQDLVVLGGRKLCSICVGEEPYHRAHWDLTLMTVCPVHSVRLLSHCPDCGRALNWKVGPLTCCSSPRCAADLRWAETAHVPESDMDGVRGLHRLLVSGVCEEFPATVSSLSVTDQIQLAFHLGCHASGTNLMPRPTSFATRHPDDVHRVLDAGWRMCMGWPSAFHEHLDRRRLHAQGSRGRYGIRKHFGSLQAWHERNDGPYAKLIGAELTNYILGHPEFATRTPEVWRTRKVAPVEQRAMTLTDAREVLGVGPEKMHTLAIENGLYLVPPSGSGAPALLRADLVHALNTECNRLLTKEDVRELLGTGKRTVDKLREAGLLPSMPAPGSPDGILYPAEGVEALLNDLERRVLSGTRRLKQPITMVGIARRVPRAGFDVCDVVQAIRANKLTPAALKASARGLHRLLFRQTDVDRFVAEITEIQGRTLSVVEAAKELGVKQEVAYHWVRTGLLATVMVDSPTETGRRITEAALESFRQGYVTGTEFARAHRLGRKWAATHLIAAGVQAVSGPSVDGARQFLFRRADLEDFDITMLVSGRSKLQPQAAHARRLTRAGSEGCRYLIGRALTREFGDCLVRRFTAFVTLRPAR